MQNDFMVDNHVCDGANMLVLTSARRPGAGEQKILKEIQNLGSIAVTCTLERAASVLEKVRVTVIILLASRDEIHTIQLLQGLRNVECVAPVLVVASETGRHDVVKFLRNGATGYLGRDSISTELALAVNTLARGYRYIS